MLLLPVGLWAHKVFSRLLPPQSRVPMSPGQAVLWQQNGTKAHYGVPSPLLPSTSGTSQLLGCPSKRAQSWAQGPSGQGRESAPTLPCLPLHCLQLAEDRSTTDEYRRQSLAYLQSSQESMRETAIKFIGEPQPLGPSCPSFAPALAAALPTGFSPVTVEPRLPGSGP